MPSDRGVPSALQCYYWPDGSVTQTFDPQSPPCIASWDDRKGNGGATSPGVSETEIRVAMPLNSTNGPTYPGLKPIVDFLNSHFQLYGRRIVVVPFTSATADDTEFNNPSKERADAAAITQLNVFASIDFVDPLSYNWSLPVFRDILTKHKIVSIAGGEMTPYGTSAQMSAHAPYEWSYSPTIDDVVRSYATAVCRQLAGRPATHAPDAALHTKTRKFAVVLPSDDQIGGPFPGLADLLKILDGCGIHAPKVVRFTGASEQALSLGGSFSQLQNDGVTSLVYFPFVGASTPQSPPTVAAGIGYSPEWVLIGWNNYLTASMLNNPSSETKGAFGIGMWNLFLPPGQEFWGQSFIAGGGGQEAVSAGTYANGRAFYNEMLLLASGIQMAGPNLTPATFAEGLRSTDFPNPRAGSAPFHQAHVGFGQGDVTMTDDYLAFWLDTRMSGAEVNTRPNANEYQAMCNVEGGRRWTEQTWPTTDRFYTPRCR